MNKRDTATTSRFVRVILAMNLMSTILKSLHILMMGLGPTDGILGAAGSFVPGDASEDLQRCGFKPNVPNLQSTSFSWSLIFICFCMILLTGVPFP
jgi:hypothetical protein